MKLVIRLVLAILMALIMIVVVDVIGLVYLVATCNGWILLGLIGLDVIILVAVIAYTVIDCHDRGIYLRG